MSASIDKLATAQQIPPPTQALNTSPRRPSAADSGNAEQAAPASADSVSVREKAEIQAAGRTDGANAATPGDSAARDEAAKSENLARPDILEAAVEAFNSRIDLSNRSTRFRVSEETGQIQIQIVDKRTDEVIRSIPSEESLKIAARFKELAGSAVGALVDRSS